MVLEEKDSVVWDHIMMTLCLFVLRMCLSLISESKSEREGKRQTGSGTGLYNEVMGPGAFLSCGDNMKGV